jgi:hypothetical protein
MAVRKPGNAGSVSRIECRAQVVGGGEVRLSIYRHLAPLTVNAIMRVLPIESRVNVQPAMVCMFTTIRVGVEKSRTNFESGDIAFLASSGLLCYFLRTVKSERPLNPIGKVDTGIELLGGLRAGGVLKLTQLPSAVDRTPAVP